VKRSEALVITVGANEAEVERLLAGGEPECPLPRGFDVEWQRGKGGFYSLQAQDPPGAFGGIFSRVDPG
jgi:hypothetical protein